MGRQSAALCALTLAGVAFLAWLGVSRLPVHAQPNLGAANLSPSLATVGAATTAAADGQGNVVLSYPNGVIAVVKPSSINGGPGKSLPQTESPIAVYRIQANGLVERLSLPMAPIMH